MGDLQCWPPLPSLGGAEADFRPVLAAPATPSPDPSLIGAESWFAAEEATRLLLQSIQPTVLSERRRKDVVEYVQMLLKMHVGCEVFPFGSVPLKTYLPDGDIDLTAISFPNMEDTMANEVRSVLEVEENNQEAEFEVKDVQFIHAEVKLIKCIVQNIVVDISFNQIGGLSTLCFLEKVDREIGKDHLFRRSIILIKAWCYYESRILGAHHGLISTYALETLVLHVFHLFHKSLDGPLAVLYRFLDYYSKFDWDNYCVSLTGPVSVSSLPEMIAEIPELNGTDLLFSNEFIKECLNLFSFSLRGYENSPRVFPQKHLNIVDPLKQYNNLGRSVSKGNYYRIRSAFAYGARKLGRILVLPVGRVADEIRSFFANTLDRHGSGERPDVQGAGPRSMDGSYIELNGFNITASQWEPKNDEMLVCSPTVQHFVEGLAEEINKINISDLDRENVTLRKYAAQSTGQHLDINSQHERPNMVIQSLAEDVVLGKQWTLDARDLTTVRDTHSRTADATCNIPPPGKACHTPRLFVRTENDRYNETSDHVYPETGSFSSGLIYDPSAANLASNVLEHPMTSVSLTGENGHNRNPKSSSLSDLNGNEYQHFQNFMCAVQSQGVLMNSYFIPTQQMSPSHYRNKHSWNSMPQQNMFSPIGANRLLPAPPFSPGSYLLNSSAISGAYATKDISRTRGTGTYFPNTNSRTYRERERERERQSLVKGKNQYYNPPRFQFSGRGEGIKDRSVSEGGKIDQSLNPNAPVFNGAAHRKPACLDIALSSHSGSGLVSDGSGFDSVEIKLESGTLGANPLQALLSEQVSKLEAVSSLDQISEPVIPALSALKQPTDSKIERLVEPYKLKDDGDFPPLAS